MSTPPQIEMNWTQRIPRPEMLGLGVQVAAVMDQAHKKGSTEAIRALTPGEIEWTLACHRGPDPPHLTDPEDVLRLLVANSTFWLIGKSRDRKVRFKRQEQLFEPPPQALEYLRQHASLICNRRLEEDMAEDDTDLDEPLPSFGDLNIRVPQATEEFHREQFERENSRVRQGIDLAKAFDQWMREHPEADRRIAAICRTAIVHLIQTGGE